MNTITFTPDGAGHAFYTEVIDLASIGPLAIERSTTVEFNGQTQEWEVRDLQAQLLHSHPSRVACLAWEHEQFN